jgi:hypothetical protein
MRYNPHIEFDKQSARTRLEWLITNHKTFEIKEVRKGRSLSQNNYLHLLLGYFGLHFGYTTEEVKNEIFKKEVNPEIFYSGVKEGIIEVQSWRSTAELDTKEMTLAIERFRDFSSKHGFYLPEPKDLIALDQIKQELSKSTAKQYL